ncbi:MAG: abortive infection system toxin AbiGii family protein [Clostridium butyricum]|nr:abortive infection system toxin AbiGii family protein [Clostridium butyricum]MDU4853198.1 abortive infection system toxin AbiGii family protein [Clostridioides difficile]
MPEKKTNKQIAKNTVVGNNNINVQNSNITINKGMEEILELARDGDNHSALKKLGMFQIAFTGMHPLYPYYKYDLNMNEKGTSIGVKANRDDAFTKYPPHGKMKLIIPDEYKWAKNIQELIRYSYEKQVALDLKAEYIKLWLGDYLSEDLNNISKVKIIPEKFPKPIPMKFEFENTSFILDYLEMGLIRIDGDWLIISNNKQKNAKIILTFSLNKLTFKGKFNIKISDKFKNDVDANLKVNEFLINMSKEGCKKLISLQDDEAVISIYESTLNSSNVKEIQKEINFLERLRQLEKFYNIKFILPEEITQTDYENILILEKAMNNKSIKGYYEELMLQLVVDSQRNQSEKFCKSEMKIDISFNDDIVTLFGQAVTFKEKWISYYHAVVENYDRVLNKIKYADDGDVIKVIYKPINNKNNEYEVKYIYN